MFLKSISYLVIYIATSIALLTPSVTSPIPDWPKRDIGLQGVHPDHLYHAMRYMILKSQLFEHPNPCYSDVGLEEDIVVPRATFVRGERKASIEKQAASMMEKLTGFANTWELWRAYADQEPNFAILMEATDEEGHIAYHCGHTVLDYSESASFLYSVATSPHNTLSREDIDLREFSFGYQERLKEVARLGEKLDAAIKKGIGADIRHHSKTIDDLLINSVWKNGKNTTKDNETESPFISMGKNSEPENNVAKTRNEERFKSIAPVMQIIGNEAKCIDNDILTEICKAGIGLIETYEDYNAINGFPVCLTFTAKSKSLTNGEISGEFFGKSGSWAENIYVDINTREADIASIQKDDSLVVHGKLPEGNSFYGNLTDNCFIHFEAITITKDGF
ncbi:MAG: hypothetical protein OIF58_01340 [Cohaesibacter sp.]|nr:hypothetical protein [Cohaesibacter sp.]